MINLSAGMIRGVVELGEVPQAAFKLSTHQPSNVFEKSLVDPWKDF
jgi:hypothetical protein